MQIVRISKGVTRINMPEVAGGWSQSFLCMSDLHLESPSCKIDSVVKDLKRAKSIGAGVLINGDLFDVTNGRDDPRRNLNTMRTSLKVTDNIDRSLDFVDSVLRPYADIIKYVGLGNHENAIRKHHGTNLVERLVERWRSQDLSEAVSAGYGGFIRFSGYTDSQETPRASKRMYLNHGKGGTAAPVTRGMIDTNRQSVWLMNTDIVWNGHNHQFYITRIPTTGLGGKDSIIHSSIAFIRTPGYLMPWDDDGEWGDDYAILSNMGPTPIGSVLLRFTYDTTTHELVDEYEEWIRGSD